MSTPKELWMHKRCLQPNVHYQVSPLLTNGCDTTGLGDVMACVLKAGHSAGTLYRLAVKTKQRARTNQEGDDRVTKISGLRSPARL